MGKVGPLTVSCVAVEGARTGALHARWDLGRNDEEKSEQEEEPAVYWGLTF